MEAIPAARLVLYFYADIDHVIEVLLQTYKPLLQLSHTWKKHLAILISQTAAY